MLVHKAMYKKIGVIRKIDAQGFGVFDMGVGKGGKTITSKTHAKCEVGDIFVREVGGKRAYLVIKKDEWSAMPANEEEFEAQKQKKSFCQKFPKWIIKCIKFLFQIILSSVLEVALEIYDKNSLI